MKLFAAFAFGLLFGCGILISGMGNPAKVLNFFDFAGTWDPSLAFVMGGALLVTAIGYRLVFKRTAPVYGEAFQLPTRQDLDARLIGGSAPFAGRVEVHEMAMEGDVMKMRRMEDGVEIPPGGEVRLEPGGLHLMFMQLEEPMKDGETRAIVLEFERAGTVEFELPVGKGARHRGGKSD